MLLLDEPTSALDPEARQSIERLGRHLADGGLVLLWVSHDLDQVRRVADQTIVLIKGRVADAAEADAFLRTGLDPQGKDDHEEEASG